MINKPGLSGYPAGEVAVELAAAGFPMAHSAGLGSPSDDHTAITLIAGRGGTAPAPILTATNCEKTPYPDTTSYTNCADPSKLTSPRGLTAHTLSSESTTISLPNPGTSVVKAAQAPSANRE